MESLTGKLLLASPRLIDPNFNRTVVIIVQHNDDGALGLILNRPLDTTVNDACRQIMEKEFSDVEGVLYQGGPCEGPLMVVHRHKSVQDMRIIPGLYFSTERGKIEWLMDNERTGAKYFVGYAGSTAGQLEKEMEIGSWLTMQAAPEHVFNEYHDLWQKLITQITMEKWIDPLRIPDDPSLN